MLRRDDEDSEDDSGVETIDLTTGFEQSPIVADVADLVPVNSSPASYSGNRENLHYH